MDYNYAISMALEAAKIRLDYYQHDPKVRYLEEADQWVEVAKIYINQELKTNAHKPYVEDFLNQAA